KSIPVKPEQIFVNVKSSATTLAERAKTKAYDHAESKNIEHTERNAFREKLNNLAKRHTFLSLRALSQTTSKNIGVSTSYRDRVDREAEQARQQAELRFAAAKERGFDPLNTVRNIMSTYLAHRKSV
ncbi:hypothetical protein KKJ25_20830, partial [Xenorhabdus bovienii]|uniref:hypothetical protein n=1 Tax=Xenorhabdus bovienii TaxID=40576 RepID=UPI00237CB7C5